MAIITGLLNAYDRQKIKRNRTLTYINLQAIKLFIVTSVTKGGGGNLPFGFSVRLKILYLVIQRLIQHFLLNKMVYLNVKYVIAILEAMIFYIYAESHWKYHTFEGYYIYIGSVN